MRKGNIQKEGGACSGRPSSTMSVSILKAHTIHPALHTLSETTGYGNQAGDPEGRAFDAKSRNMYVPYRKTSWIP
ncbi:MAG: hypothetical protein PWQ57_1769 [Desulfovibrionales bacterium]|jgi:hypothetical protein|nr:hypothetical protein [Desulfovibrionales bacterium]